MNFAFLLSALFHLFNAAALPADVMHPASGAPNPDTSGVLTGARVKPMDTSGVLTGMKVKPGRKRAMDTSGVITG